MVLAPEIRRVLALFTPQGQFPDTSNGRHAEITAARGRNQEVNGSGGDDGTPHTEEQAFNLDRHGDDARQCDLTVVVAIFNRVEIFRGRNIGSHVVTRRFSEADMVNPQPALLLNLLYRGTRPAGITIAWLPDRAWFV